jgi:hypothetical protein
MKEFMFYIRNIGDHKSTLSPEEHKAFLKECEEYIAKLKSEKRLLAAQPIAREGKIISGKEGAWKEDAIDATKEIQVGYYHILASDLEEAITIAKGNPEFAYGTTARIEVRPIKMKEETTGYVYPK